ncbi:hypothetical protein LWC34_45050 [Kibdelosporangium philippinense]|uniref:Uncharacterized protein n=1 Tax=Kibdelosporangium philippinense TaxID=211113 RepID=A0ABS8ZVP6_9PSEU|nr:hypothetical protein [Kibdelosporangium philippinense]MCE7009927.1 hypothetical protein [Kibdelosporangium philippinense]
MTIYTHGDIRQRFIQGIILRLRAGLTLERHLLRSGKALLGGIIRGSTDVPDSLGHKQVITSGRLGPRGIRANRQARQYRESLSHHPHLPASFYYIFSIPSKLYRPRVSARKTIDKWFAFDFNLNRVAQNREKSLEKTRRFY